MARPRKHILEQRTERMNLRFTPEALAKIQEQALVAGLPASTYVHDVACGHKVKAAPHPVSADLVRALNMAGSNLNQITKYLNAGRPLAADAERILAKLEGVVDRILADFDGS